MPRMNAEEIERSVEGELDSFYAFCLKRQVPEEFREVIEDKLRNKRKKYRERKNKTKEDF